MESKEKVAARVRRCREKKKGMVELPCVAPVEKPSSDPLLARVTVLEGQVGALQSSVTALQETLTALQEARSLADRVSQRKDSGKVDASLFSRVVREKESRLRGTS